MLGDEWRVEWSSVHGSMQEAALDEWRVRAQLALTLPSQTTMDFELTTAIPVLERTPAALEALLVGLPDAWTAVNEGWAAGRFTRSSRT